MFQQPMLVQETKTPNPGIGKEYRRRIALTGRCINGRQGACYAARPLFSQWRSSRPIPYSSTKISLRLLKRILKYVSLEFRLAQYFLSDQILSPSHCVPHRPGLWQEESLFLFLGTHRQVGVLGMVRVCVASLDGDVSYQNSCTSRLSPFVRR